MFSEVFISQQFLIVWFQYEQCENVMIIQKRLYNAMWKNYIKNGQVKLNVLK